VRLHPHGDVGEVVDGVHAVRRAGRDARAEAGQVLASFAVSIAEMLNDVNYSCRQK
jgi:hypothetical protein